jgi:(4-(4-[2-(gamma-L-glutamylamino)ethyl]phenoxymethyl)furan-2-yl)methanamine synthase
MNERWIGIDVGGANLKLVCDDRTAWSVPFPLWKQSSQLATAIGQLLQLAIAHDRNLHSASIALTMTGELADCYRDRAEGVRDIVRRTREAIGSRTLRVYDVTGQWLTDAEAIDQPDRCAASNWHAIARLACSFLPPGESGLLIDIGSTTTDLIPISHDRLLTDSRTDFDRLQTGELLYLGLERTPLCALARTLPYRDDMIPVMNEWFATTSDAGLLLALIDEDPSDRATADGQPRTRDAARCRMARMIGLDHRTFLDDDATKMALFIWQRCSDLVAAAIDRLRHRIMQSGHAMTWNVLSGHGNALAAHLLDRPTTIELKTRIGERASRAAPAFALTQLAISDRGTIRTNQGPSPLVHEA